MKEWSVLLANVVIFSVETVPDQQTLSSTAFGALHGRSVARPANAIIYSI